MDFFFSPSGTVGRAAWWGMQLITVPWVFFTSYFAIAMIVSADHLTHLPATLEQALAAFTQAMSLQTGPLTALLLIGLAGFWCNCVIEIKRWHDRGMSGGWILLRLVTFILPYTGTTGATFLIPISFFQLINLGFLGPAYVPLNDVRAKSENVVSSMRIVFRVGMMIGLVFLLAAMVLTYFAFKSKERLVQSNAGTVLPPIAGNAGTVLPPTSANVGTVLPPIAMSAPAPAPVAARPLDESAYHGTSATDFGPHWVMVDGQKVEGITAVHPAPEAQVSLLNSSGGMNVPAAKLPQGFLDAWHITPQLLKSEQ